MGEEILFLDEEAFSHYRGHKIALIPQNPSGSLNPLMRNGDQIGEVMKMQKNARVREIRRLLTLLRSKNRIVSPNPTRIHSLAGCGRG
jgi:peptide/nickel transport system ATP-binding protein